jgi:hypothetical protein
MDTSIFFRAYNGAVFYVVNNTLEIMRDLVIRLASCITGD